MTFARTALFLTTAVCAAQAQRGLLTPPAGVLTNKRGVPIDFQAPSKQIFRDQFLAEDYIFDLLGRIPNEEGEGGEVRSCNVADLPALFEEGAAMTLFTIEPCGVNLPHTHPEATEILFVISGEPRTKFLETAHVELNGGRTLVNRIGVGEFVMFPEGLLHYQQNLGCQVTQYLSALPSEDPGVSTTTFALASLPAQGLDDSLGQPANVVDQLVFGLPEGPALPLEEDECLRRCGLF